MGIDNRWVDDLGEADRDELERLVEAFETAWRAGDVPTPADYLPADGPLRRALLPELLHTDLECRLTAGQSVSINDYLQTFPELEDDPSQVVALVRAQHELTQGTDPISPAPNDTAATPQRLGRFELLEELGAGSSGTVYRARDVELGRVVAVKVPRPGGLTGVEETDRFLREARSAAGLCHPGIVALHDVGRIDRLCYLVSEFVPGITLAQSLLREPRTPRQAAELVAQVADALHCAHGHGIVHRDVKPSNILIDTEGRPRLTDFGLARHLTGDQTATETGMLLGTPAYMPPEQARGDARHVDGRADVYSLGVVLYELLTGQRPFHGDARQLLLQVVDVEPLPPRRLRPELPRDLEKVCLKAMSKEPAGRYATAADMAEDLRRFLRGEPVRARPPGPLERGIKWARRHPAVAALVVCLVLGLTAGVAGTLLYLERERQLRRETEQSELLARRYQYAAEMNLAYDAWNKDQIERARDILRRLRPGPGQVDLRGFEWRYLWGLCERVVRLRGHAGTITSLAFSADGSLLASGCADRTIKVWDTATWTECATLRGHASTAVAVAFSPDGERLASAGHDGTLRLWQPRTGEELVRSRRESHALNALAFSPDGKLLATAGDDLILKLWDAETLHEVARLEWQTNYRLTQSKRLYCLAFSPDGKTLAAGSWNDGIIRLWDMASRTVRGVLPVAHHGPYYVTFSPDGQTLAVPDAAGSVRLLDVRTGHLQRTLAGQATLRSVAFTPDSKKLATAAADGVVRLWEVASQHEPLVLHGHTGAVSAVAVSPDGRTVVSGGNDQVLHLYDAATGRPRVREDSIAGRQQLDLGPDPQAVGGIDLSPDGKTLAVATGTHLRLHDVSSGQLTQHFSPAAGHSMAVRFLRDGCRVITGNADLAVLQWDASTGKPPTRFLSGAHPVYSLACSPDGSTLATGGGVPGQPGEVMLWDLLRRGNRRHREGHPLWVRSVAFTPDGRTLATGCGDGVVRLWDPETWQLKREMVGHTDTVFALAFAPDGKTLASGGGDGVIRIWDPALGRERITLHGHVGSVYSLEFAPDGTSLVSGGQDGAIKFWDPTIDRELASLQGHSGRVTGVAFTPDGSVLASGGFDAVVNLWHAPP